MSTLHYAGLYRAELLDKVIPFWMRHSRDSEYGGYFTCLLRDGRVFDTDKFVWLQARQVWTFSMLFNRIERQSEWLDMAKYGADFLLRHGRDSAGDWYFALDRKGKPLVQPYNIFSDCFAAMAFGQLYLATGEETYAEVAVATFHRILDRQGNPKGKYNKAYPGTRPLKNFALPMILCNLCLEIEPLLDQQLVEETIDVCIHEVMEVFYNADRGLILENVMPDGCFSDSFEGRLLNPGHAIEAMWFIMDLGRRRNDNALINRAVDIALHTAAYGWDDEQGGIFYFLDVEGYPPQQLEWDQKLWWVHLETLVAMGKGYRLSGRAECLEWFEKVHDYTWPRFRDPEYGEWYGYLNRRGEVLLPLKGGKWKGCFHVPRGLLEVSRGLEGIGSN